MIDRDKGHGRIEVRKIQVIADPELNQYLRDELGFPYVAQVFRLERTRKNVKKNETQTEIVYGITSLTPEQADALQLLKLNRGHWAIENRLHYVRDVTFDEDRSQVRKGAGAQVMATLRNLVIGLLRIAGVKTIAAGLRWLGWNRTQALRLIGFST